MKARILFLILLFSCTKDTILIEQIPAEVNAIINYTNDCQDVYARMISDTEVLVFSGSHAIHSDDDFATMSAVLNTTGGYGCNNQVIFFDGLNAWTREAMPYGGTSNRVSFEGQDNLFIQSGYSDFTFTPSLLSYSKTDHPLFENLTSFLMAAQNGSKLDIYQCDAHTKTGTRIGSTNTLVTPLAPRRMFKVNDLWILSAQHLNNPPAVTHAVFTSTDKITWQGPFDFDELRDYETIWEVSGSGATLVARVVNYEVPSNYSTCPATQIDGCQTATFRISKDAGQTWTVFGDGKGFIDVQVIGPETFFGITPSAPGDRGPICALYKSTDGGATWTTEATPFYAERIHFYNATDGLAMAEATLQITHDGGKTWKLVLTSPYELP